MGAARRTLLGLWIEIRVIPVLLWSVTAITLGTGIAAAEGGGLSLGGYLSALAIGVLLQGLVAHCVNDVVDWRSGTDADPAPRAISGGSKTIPAGLLGIVALRRIGVTAGAAAIAIGVAAAAAWGWWLLAFGALGLAGAVLYTLPPVRAAYRPVAGEAVAFSCVWACVAGAHLLQRGTVSGTAALAGAVYAASCVAMLMMHHYLDRGPDARARPPKRTSIVVLGAGGRRYTIAWAALAAAGAVALTAADRAFWVLALALGTALLVHLATTPDDPDSVTRSELAVIGLGMAGGLGTAAALWGPLAWTAAIAVGLAALELRLSGRVGRELASARGGDAVGSTGRAR